MHFAVVGAGGFAREVMAWARLATAMDRPEHAPAPKFYFVQSTRPDTSVLNGLPLTTIDAFSRLPGEKLFSIAIADSAKRRVLADEISQFARPFSLVSPNSELGDDVTIGEGAIFCPFTYVGSNVRIGRHFHCNTGCYVAHDCVIGDYVTLAPKVCCNGTVTIGDHAYIGAGAVIMNGRPGEPITIGERAVVGMGAVVLKSVPPGTTVVGNPARLVQPVHGIASRRDIP